MFQSEIALQPVCAYYFSI